MLQETRSERLRKDERVKKKSDFAIIAQEGTRKHTKHFLIIARRNDQGFSRVGAVASKKMGKAVERNRAKRLMREFFRKNKDHLAPSTDYVIVGKKGAQDLSYAQVSKELDGLLEHREKNNSEETSP